MDHTDWNNSAKAASSGHIRLAGVEDQEYDALADLFLGESELAPEPFSSTGTEDTEPSMPQSRTPIRIAPASNESIGQSTQSAMDLIDDVQTKIDQTAQRAAGNIPCIEAVLLGHLPVRASLWVRQYACSTARRRGEIVALIRAASGSTSVDLISGTRQMQTSECDSLNEALDQVNQIADRVILRVDETTEPELLDRDEVDEITILTGADEAAVVASYRLIKTLTSVWDSDEAIGTPHLRLAVMGATGQQVADASAKLTRAVDAFLDRPIEIIDAAGRIDATGTTNIFRDSVAHSATGILDELVEIGCGLYIPSETLARPVHEDPAPLDPERGAVAVHAEQAPVVSGKGLASLIQGLTTLETRCPFARDVELCVDARGDLHLVTGDEHDRPMSHLETVRAWVRDHFPLILRAEPELAIPDANNRGSEIGLHLISSDPHTLRGLIDSPVRMYALASVPVGDHSVRVATPIN